MTPIGSTSSNIRRAVGFMVLLLLPPRTLAEPSKHEDDCAPRSSSAPSQRTVRSGLAGGGSADDLGVVAGALHAEHLGGYAPIRVAATAGLAVTVEESAGQVGLGVERPADAHQVGLPGLDDLRCLG